MHESRDDTDPVFWNVLPKVASSGLCIISPLLLHLLEQVFTLVLMLCAGTKLISATAQVTTQRTTVTGEQPVFLWMLLC